MPISVSSTIPKTSRLGLKTLAQPQNLGGAKLLKEWPLLFNDMENISRGRADGMSALREFLLDQRRVSRGEVIKKREDARDRRTEDKKKGEPPKQAKASQSPNANNREEEVFQKSGFSVGRT
ncbi:MAG: hypothetical protein Q9204_007212, partial [Flavoplaca sp. TL-2023a]